MTVPRKVAHHYRVVPVAKRGNITVLVTDNPGNDIEEELSMILDFSFMLEKAEPAVIERFLELYYFENYNTVQVHVAKQLSFDNNFLDNLILEAKKLKSSDIHIESFEDRGRVRVRIDGMMVERYSVTKSDYPALVNKIKIMSNMDIAEKRLPQDGRIHYSKNGENFDMRVSVLPTLHGEKVVLRLLNNDATNIHIESLGMTPEDLSNYLQGVKKPNGILLISGPTGSGKTTTLYATLKYLNKETTNILTTCTTVLGNYAMLSRPGSLLPVSWTATQLSMNSSMRTNTMLRDDRSRRRSRAKGGNGWSIMQMTKLYWHRIPFNGPRRIRNGAI